MNNIHLSSSSQISLYFSSETSASERFNSLQNADKNCFAVFGHIFAKIKTIILSIFCCNGTNFPKDLAFTLDAAESNPLSQSEQQPRTQTNPISSNEPQIVEIMQAFPPIATPLFFKIKDAEGHTHGYLLGTCHVLNEQALHWHPVILHKLQKATHLGLEINTQDSQIREGFHADRQLEQELREQFFREEVDLQTAQRIKNIYKDFFLDHLIISSNEIEEIERRGPTEALIEYHRIYNAYYQHSREQVIEVGRFGPNFHRDIMGRVTSTESHLSSFAAQYQIPIIHLESSRASHFSNINELEQTRRNFTRLGDRARRRCLHNLFGSALTINSAAMHSRFENMRMHTNRIINSWMRGRDLCLSSHELGSNNDVRENDMEETMDQHLHQENARLFSAVGMGHIDGISERLRARGWTIVPVQYR